MSYVDTVPDRLVWFKKDIFTYTTKGPWDKEPDLAYWQYRGLDCAISRSSLGSLCGYVGLPIGHPLYEIGYPYSCIATNVEISFSGFSLHHLRLRDIENAGCNLLCESPWWVGFSCSRFGDLIPGMEDIMCWGFSVWGNYRDFNYVTNAVHELAEILAEQLPKTKKISTGRVINVADVESKDYTPLPEPNKRILKL